MKDEWIRRDSWDFRQERDDDMGEEAERQERRGMADPIWLPEDLEARREVGGGRKLSQDSTAKPLDSPAPEG